jgi:hypothetical protein
MALLCEGDSVGDKKKRPADARSHRKGNTDHSTNVSSLWNLFLMTYRVLLTDTLVKRLLTSELIRRLKDHRLLQLYEVGRQCGSYFGCSGHRERDTTGHQVYRKPTHTDQYFNLRSYHLQHLKRGLMPSLHSRASTMTRTTRSDEAAAWD